MTCDYKTHYLKLLLSTITTLALMPPSFSVDNAITPVLPLWAKSTGHDKYGQWADIVVKGVTQRMRWCPSGTFLMGTEPDTSPLGVNSLADIYNHGISQDFDSVVQHQVTLTHGFWMADSSCTQALWHAVMESPINGDPELPEDNVRWIDAQHFLMKLNALDRGANFTLPTEAQREYACRAGVQSEYEGAALDAVAWHHSNSGYHTHPVKQKLPNAWGLYDMHGNVWEWCLDLGSPMCSRDAVTDPMGPQLVPKANEWNNDRHIYRGGSALEEDDRSCNAWTRADMKEFNGFRFCSVVVH